MENNGALAIVATGWLALSTCLPSICTAKVIHVDDDAPADFATIQAAIDTADDGDIVLLAAGIYTGHGNRDIDFRGKAITVRSQDGPETCIIDAGGRQYINDPDAEPEPHRGIHFHSGENTDSIVQGLTITGGYLRWDGGGGICCDNASPQIVDCIVTANVARWGGGLAIHDSHAVIVNCIISDNLACFYPWRKGGPGFGGGISMYDGGPTLSNCLITGNVTAEEGGGISCGGDFTLRNCTICDNRAGDGGGGMYCGYGSSKRGLLGNCILWNNESRDSFGSEILLGSGILGTIHLELDHCIVRDGRDSIVGAVHGSWTGTDPCFVQPGYWDPNGTPSQPNDDFWVAGDYHLKSRAGRWNPETESWVQNDVTSPCIDAGDPCCPVSDEPLPNGGIINIGAYGGTVEASKSYLTSTRVLYVDANAVGDGDGSSWSRAYASLQDALAAADPSESPIEIRVAQGRYTPDRGAGVVPGDREAAFQLLGRVTLLGGYAGAAASDPNDRDANLYETVLSGDLEDNDNPATLPLALLVDSTRTDNSYGLVRMEGYNLFPCVLNGFTIDSATESPALVINLCYPSVQNCVFTNNASGAIAVDLPGGHPQFARCRFSHNAAPAGGAIYTNGLRREPKPTRITLKGCYFMDNYAAETGGAVVLRAYEALSVQRCVFVRNSARFGGGAFLESADTANMVNCLFAGNGATETGGGVYLEDTVLDIACCTFAGNRAKGGRAVAAPRDYGYSPSITAVSTILRDGGSEVSYAIPLRGGRYGNTGSIAYSDIQGDLRGEGNIDTDPLFANPGFWDLGGSPDDPNDDYFVEGDYHLKSQAGRWDAVTQSWISDEVTSPCIDAGDPNTPVRYEPVPHGGRINMGAYGGTAEASKSIFDGSPVEGQ